MLAEGGAELDGGRAPRLGPGAEVGDGPFGDFDERLGRLEGLR